MSPDVLVYSMIGSGAALFVALLAVIVWGGLR